MYYYLNEILIMTHTHTLIEKKREEKENNTKKKL